MADLTFRTRGSSATESAPLESSLGQLGEESFDGIEPGGRLQRVVEDKARMVIKPAPDLGMLVAAVIAEDDVDDLVGRDLGLDRIEEADELLMAVALYAAANDLAFEHVKGGVFRV
jgi:hypothetical protein